MGKSRQCSLKEGLHPLPYPENPDTITEGSIRYGRWHSQNWKTHQRRKRKMLQRRPLPVMLKNWTLLERLHPIHGKTTTQETPRKTQENSSRRRRTRIRKPNQHNRRSHCRKDQCWGFLKGRSPVMQDSPKTKTKHVSENKSIIIPTSVLQDTFAKDITTRALIDCSSQLDCIDHGFVLKHNLPKLWLSTPIRVKNVDGTYNEKGTIKFVTQLFLRLKMVVHWILFHIMGCGNENIILGLPWLKKINPRIDWVTETVTIPRRTDQTEALNYKTGITQRTSYTKPTYHEFLPNEYEREAPEYPDETSIRMIRGEGTLTPKFKKRGKEFILSIRKSP